jgi:heme/copper-type cytochrome/quinol oxidase subunit 1
MLYALGFIGLFTLGGLTGLFLATLAIDVHVTDTYFVVAHFHYIMVGGAIMAYLGGLHFWWPKITGRLYPEFWAKIAAAIIFIGFNLTFFPQFILGYLGMPRRYYSYPDELQVWNVLSTAGATILGLGYMLPMIYLTYSAFKGAQAPDNPWGAKGLGAWWQPAGGVARPAKVSSVAVGRSLRSGSENATKSRGVESINGLLVKFGRSLVEFAKSELPASTIGRSLVPVKTTVTCWVELSLRGEPA